MESAMRVGIGYDIHRLAPGRPLRLGGVAIPSEAGPVGHSDGDVVLHAICDALLGAAALGDIGDHFPDHDPALAGIESAALLARTLEMVREAGFEPVNLDVNIMAERPRLGDRKGLIKANVARLLGIEQARVSIKARTAEGLGPVGQGLAIAAQVAILVREKTE